MEAQEVCGVGGGGWGRRRTEEEEEEGGGCDEQMRVVDVADKEMDSLQVRYYQTSE